MVIYDYVMNSRKASIQDILDYVHRVTGEESAEKILYHVMWLAKYSLVHICDFDDDSNPGN